MVVGSDFLSELNTSVLALFNQMMASTETQWQKIAMTVPAGGETTHKFNWLGSPPMPRAFRGTLEFGKSFPHNYTVTIEDQAIGLRIDRRELRTDKLGIISLHLATFMDGATRYKEKIVFEHLSDGFTLSGFTGSTFYSASHSYGDGQTLNNTGTVALSAADPTEYYNAWATINTSKDDSGSPNGHVPTDLVYYPTKRKIVRELLHADNLSNGATNITKGDVADISAPWLKTETEWHLLANNKPIKPIILLVDEEFNMVTMGDENGVPMFYNHAYETKIEGAMKVGYGDPTTAYGSTGTG